MLNDRSNGVRLKMKPLFLIVLVLIVVAGCSNMEDQPKLADPYQSSPNFGRAAREILPESVPVGFERDNEHLSYGTIDGELADTLPFELTADILATGQMRFNQFCSPCHGYDGSGEGIIALEGFPQPATYHTEELRAAPVGRIYQVITNGQGVMFSYAGRIIAEDRWAIAAYVKALQLSQYASVSELPEDAQAEVMAEDAAPEETDAMDMEVTEEPEGMAP